MADAKDCIYWVAIQHSLSHPPTLFGPYLLGEANTRQAELVFANPKANISPVFLARDNEQAARRAASYLTLK